MLFTQIMPVSSDRATRKLRSASAVQMEPDSPYSTRLLISTASSSAIPSGADSVEVNLYYQTTSREYIEFLRDEINGSGNLTLEASAYVIQTDPFFEQLKGWGGTIWALWKNNMNVDGARPFLMAQATVGDGGGDCNAAAPTMLSATPGNQQVVATWAEILDDPTIAGYWLYYDQAGKTQLVADIGTAPFDTYTDTGLTNGLEYCYTVTSYSDTTSCESDFSNIVCATPNNQGQARVGVDSLETGRYETQGKGKNRSTVFVLTSAFDQGDGVVVQAYLVDGSNGLPVANAIVDLDINGPESASLTTESSDNSGLAQITWQTQAPNKKGQGGTTPGCYGATVSNVTAAGYTWDGALSSTGFTIGDAICPAGAGLQSQSTGVEASERIYLPAVKN